MLPRLLEPESMDTPEDARDYDAMDHSEVNARFVAAFLQSHGPCRGGEILDVGTGTARIPIALCQADPRARVLGIDLAEHMLRLGRENVEQAEFSPRIRLVLGDAKLLKLADGTFEAVVSNSIVHHIPEPGPALAEMVRLVAPGGTLFIRDLVRPPDVVALDRIVETYAGDESSEARAMFWASLHAALTVEEIRTLVTGLGLPPEDVSMTSDRHWTWTWKRPYTI
jgi:ubiquinone/menaquinone biosynthesis C-methylase UbiE